MSNGSLFANQVTPYGRYHLTSNPVILFDGITPGHPNPGVLNGFGQFSLNGMLNVDTAANGGVESRFAVQAIVVDPGAPAGLTLSACLNVDQWVQ